MRSLRFLGVLAVFSLAFSGFGQTAPPSPPQLTWIRYYTIDPMQGEEFVSHSKRSAGAVFDRLLAEGKIVSWGIAVPYIMSGQDYTHGMWLTMNNWAAADEVTRGFEEAMKQMTAAERKKDMSTYMSMVKQAPRDVVLRHQVQPATPPAPTFKLNYIRSAFSTVRPGRGSDRVALFREATVPIYTDLQARGVIGPWGLSTQDVGGEDWTHMVWYFTDDLASLDQARETTMAVPEGVREERAARMREMVDPTKTRVEILRVVHSATAPPRAR